MNNRPDYHKWTKTEFETVIDLWDTHSVPEIAKKLGIEVGKITGAVSALRKNGIKLASKDNKSRIVDIIKEIKKERNI